MPVTEKPDGKAGSPRLSDKEKVYLWAGGIGICAFFLIALLAYTVINAVGVNNLTKTGTTPLPTFKAVSPSLGQNVTTSTPTTSVVTSTIAGWQLYQSPDGHFTASFPTIPTMNQSQVPLSSSANVMVNSYQSSVNDNLYIVNDSLYPVAYQPSDTNPTLQRMVQGSLASGSTNKLVSSTFLQFGGYNAIEYVIQNTTKGQVGYVKNLLIPTKNSVYILQVTSLTTTFPNFDAFINSFQSLY